MESEGTEEKKESTKRKDTSNKKKGRIVWFRKIQQRVGTTSTINRKTEVIGFWSRKTIRETLKKQKQGGRKVGINWGKRKIESFSGTSS